MLRCRILGHRYRFSSERETLRWTCGRCGAVGGEKRCPTAAQAARLARELDREDRDELGRRAPLGLLPLRLVRARRRRPGSS